MSFLLAGFPFLLRADCLFTLGLFGLSLIQLVHFTSGLAFSVRLIWCLGLQLVPTSWPHVQRASAAL